MLLSFEYVRLSYPKNGFQLCADGGAQKWKSNDSLTNYAWKYFSYIAWSIISKKKFWAKNTLVASYSRAVIAWKMCWKVTFSHRFDNNFRKARNFWMPPECFRTYTFRARIWTQILHYFGGNQECYCPLNMSYRVTRKTDSNYLPMQGRENGSLTIHS